MQQAKDKNGEMAGEQIMKKAIIIVLDSVGIGAMEDAAAFGDAGCNTLGHILEAFPSLELPWLNGLGLGRLVPALENRKQYQAPFNSYVAKMAEASQGKDTVTGHWEMVGVVRDTPWMTFPQGFPEEFVQALSEKAEIDILGNEAASGTEIIARLGDAHVETGRPILYTSADSVLQLAAHEKIIGLEKLYALCRMAREMTVEGPYQVARIIARPFVGTSGNYTRTANRRDFALSIPSQNLLQDLLQKNWPVAAIGKIEDIFAGVAFTKAIHTVSNRDGMKKLMNCYQAMEKGLLFVNLVDFDMQFGHRRDVHGYGQALQEFDQDLGRLCALLEEDTLLVLTADHGCDPTAHGTDHTRELVPLIFAGAMVQANSLSPIYCRSSFADLGATLADYFEVAYTGRGTSFAKEVFYESL